MRLKHLLGVSMLAIVSSNTAVSNADMYAFDDAKALSGLEVSGAVSIDVALKHGGAGALKLEPGSKAVITLREEDGTGKVEFWVYEDEARPAAPKRHAAGAMWGLMQADGHSVTAGPIYAPYLAGDTTYAVGAFNPDKNGRPWHGVQYLGIKRKEGWHKWTFDFDPDKGMRILFDGKDINEKYDRFIWNKSKLDGFTNIVFYGDAADSGQVLWVDDLTVTLGPPAKKKTLWPPPPPTPPADLTVLPPQAEWNATPYARWENGPGKSDGYFPVAVWLQEPKDAKLYKAAGINLYVGLWKGPTEEQLDTLREAGMPVVCAQNELALQKHLNDKLIVGWMHGDEPDNAHKFADYWGGDKERIKEAWPEIYKSRGLDKNEYRGYGPSVPPKWIVRDYESIQANDPTRPIMVNLGQCVSWPNWKGRGERSGHMEDYPEYIKGCDIVSFDIYPAAHSAIGVKDALWYVPQGVRRLRLWSGDRKVAWNAMECTEIAAAGAKPTPEQVKAEVWMSIIHGSRGLIYFVHKFTSPRSTRKLLEDPEMLAAVTAINNRIHKLAPVLNSPTIADGAIVTSTNAKTPVHAMVKQHDGATYVFAVAMYEDETTATIQVAGLSGSKTVEVLDESRTITIANGKFTDKFKGNAVHLYKIVD